MSDKLEIVAQALLYPTEVVKVALETRALLDAAGSDTNEIDTSGPDTLGKGILAVVSHRASASSAEEGCVFVFQERPRTPWSQASPATPSLEYVFAHAFPVLGNFSISMAQTRRNTIDLRPSSATSALNQSRAEFKLTLVPGHDPMAERLSLMTHDTRRLKAVIAECKRLKDISDAEKRSETMTIYPWIAPYVAETKEPPILSPIPPDLRALRIPSHTLLSAASAGQPGDETSDIATIRADWVRRKVEDELLPTCGTATSLRIRIGTFNVNGKLPSQDLSAWVGRRAGGSELIPPLREMSPLSLGDVGHSPLGEPRAADDHASSTSTLVGRDTLPKNFQHVPSDSDDPDIIVLAFQELDLSTEALLYSTRTVREDAWCAATFAGLGEKASLYEKMASKQLVGMLLVVIVKKEHRPCFKDIKATSVGAGIMSIMGNKGATALRLTYVPVTSSTGDRQRPTVLTFVNSHLAAFDEMYDRRNADFHDLSARLVFDSGLPLPSTPAQTTASTPNTIPINVYETDVLFWMGDLNYRINLPDADIRELLSSSSDLRARDTRVLLDYDQLSLAIRTKKAFDGFSEYPISHPPSYRFSAGMATDSQGYDIKRKPAWTDRILHINSPMLGLEQLAYSSHPAITMSDHKPVTAEFDIRIPSLGSLAYDSFVRGLWRDLAFIEHSENVPKIKLNDTTVNFGRISYKRPVRRTLQLENIGKVPCVYRFIAAQEEAQTHPGWLTINQMAGLLLPGQKMDIVISAYVDNATASRLNLGFTQLEHMLILHTALGKDHFIAVNGEYERTCFANSLSLLARLPGPIRALRALEQLLPEDHATAAPKEIMRLIKWIMSKATEVDGLFLQAGEDARVQRIRECLDTGTEFDDLQCKNEPPWAHAFADTLLQFLDALPEPFFPAALHSRCAQVTNKDEAFQLLDGLPSVSLNVWISVTAILHYITQQPSSKSNVDKLVAVFTSVLLRDDITSHMPTSIVGKRKFLRYFIV